MSDLLQIDVAKILKKIPLENVADILVVAVMDDNSLKTFSTMTDEDTLDTLLDAELIYQDDSEKINFKME